MLLILLLMQNSCEKQPNAIYTSLSGKLLAANSNEPLAGAKIELVRINYVGFTSGGAVLDTTRTDAHGNYSFDFSTEYSLQDATHQLVCYYPNFYSTRNITGPFPIDGDHFNLVGKQSFNPELHPFAWLKVRLNFTSLVYRFGMNPAFEEIHPVNIFNPSREEFIVKTMGNADNLLSFFIYSPDSLVTIVDTIWCGKIDTILKVINY